MERFCARERWWIQFPFSAQLPRCSPREKRHLLLVAQCHSNGRLAQFSRPLVSAVILCALSGCIVGPDYRRPSAPVPQEWNQPAERGLSPAPGDQAQWWRLFGDPVLEDLVARSVEGNLGLREAYYRILEARAKRRVVSGELFPVVDAWGSYSRSRRSSNAVPDRNPAGAFDLFSTGFDAAWELDIFGRVRRSLEAADAEVCIAANDRNGLLVTLLAEVAANYIDVRTLQNRIEIARQNLEVQEKTHQLTVRRFEAGAVSELDVQQAKSNLLTTKSVIPALQADLQRAKNRLCVLQGQSPRNLDAELGNSRPIPSVPRRVAIGLPAELLRRRPDVSRAEWEVGAESALVGVAAADLYPRFALTGMISVDAMTVSSLFAPDSVVHGLGPSFSWNILNFGRIRHNVRARGFRKTQAVIRYQSTVLSAIEEVENALVLYAREQERAESLALAVGAAKQARELAEEQYVGGKVSFQSLLDAQQSMFLLEEQLAVSRGNVLRNLIALYKALGGGWEYTPRAADEGESGAELVGPEVPATSDETLPLEQIPTPEPSDM